MEEKLYVDCLCDREEHVLRFELDEEWYEGCNVPVYVSTFLPDVPFFKRLKNAVKYLFGYKCAYGHFEGTILENPDQIQPIMNMFEKALGTISKRDGEN